MDANSYYNVFETKGIEYIITIVFFLLLIPFWLVLDKKTTKIKEVKEALGKLTFDLLRIQQGLMYGKNHLWSFLDNNGLAKVGLDDLLVHLTGNVKIVFAKQEGETVSKGEKIAEIIKDDKKLDIFSPISGMVLNQNNHIQETGLKPGSNPYRDSWLYKVKPKAWINETSEMMLGDNSTEWFKGEIGRFKDFLADSMQKHMPEVEFASLQDGGELVDKPLSELPTGIWTDFQEQFLAIKA